MHPFAPSIAAARLRLVLAVALATTTAALPQASPIQFIDALAIPSNDIVDVTAMTVGPSGEIYLAGFFFGTVDLDPGPGTFEVTSNGLSDGYLIKLGPDGSFEWGRTAGAAQDDLVFGLGLTVAPDGDLYSVGIFRGTIDIDGQSFTSQGDFDALLIRHAPDGSVSWIREWSSTGLIAPHDIALTEDGDLVIGGAFQASVDFDLGLGSDLRNAAGLSDAWLAKYDSDGELIWVNTAGSTNWDECWNVASDATGSAYCAGRFHGPIDFDPGLGSEVVAGSNDGFVWKLDASGDFDWVGSFPGGSSIAETIDVSPSGRLITAGSFSSSVDVDPGPGTNELTAIDLPRNLFVVELDPADGSALVHKQLVALGTTGRFEARFLDDERLLLGSRITGTVDIDPGPADFTFTAEGQSDAMFLTLRPDGSIESASVFGGPTDDLVNDVFGRDGEILVAGRFGSTADLAPGPAESPFSAQGLSDGFLVRMTDGRVCPDPSTIDYQGLTPATCSTGFVDVFDRTDLDAYHQDFGWDGSAAQGVRIRFNPQQSIEVISPCEIRFAGEAGFVDMTGARICGYGLAGVRLNGNAAFSSGAGASARELRLVAEAGDAVVGARLDVSAESVRIEAGELATVGQSSRVEADAVDLVSVGVDTESRATLQQGVDLTAGSVRLEAFHVTAISFDAQVAADTVELTTGSSGIDAVAAIRDGAQVSAGQLNVISSSRLRLGDQANIDATASAWLDAVLCVLAGSANVTAPQKSGTCFK